VPRFLLGVIRWKEETTSAKSRKYPHKKGEGKKEKEKFGR